MIRVVAILVLLFSASGCFVATAGSIYENEPYPNIVYGGTRFEAGNVHGGLLNVPACVVADTVCLPYTIPRSIYNSEHPGGNPGPPPTRLPVMDDAGDEQLPLELGSAKAAAFIFLGVECPISNSYAPEINRIISDYSAKGVNFYVVYPEAGLTPDQIKQHATAYGYRCPALMDGDHRLTNLFHITVTSQCVVLGPNAKVLYNGRIDDRYLDFGKKRFAPTTHELRDALDAVLGDRPVPTPMTKAVGCPI
jgi:hypothetical protein